MSAPGTDRFDCVARLASGALRAPVVFMSQSPKDKGTPHTVLASVGIEAAALETCGQLCERVLASQCEPVIVLNNNSAAFASSWLAEHDLPFFAGVPILSTEPGQKPTPLGVLCVADTRARDSFSPSDVQTLLDLGRLAADELLLHNEDLVNLVQAKQQYIACTVHDLKTPLCSFRLCVDMLAEMAVSEEQRSLVAQADASVHMMSQIVNKSLDVARAWTSGDAPLISPTPMSIRDVLAKAEGVIRAYPRQVPISFEVSPDCPEKIFSDGPLVCQCIVNFLSNSCKHTPSGHVRCVATPLPPAMGRGVRVEVRDTGKGLSDEVAKHLFKPFVRVGEDTGKGTGLGLFAVRTNVAMLRGRCGGHGASEGGAVFWLEVPDLAPNNNDEDDGAAVGAPCQPDADADMSEVPAGPDEPARPYWVGHCEAVVPNVLLTAKRSRQHSNEPGSSSPVPPRSPLALRHPPKRARTGRSKVGAGAAGAEAGVEISAVGLTALVVDDSETTRLLVARAFRTRGVSCVACASAEEALSLLQQGPWDVVVSDHSLGHGNMTGLEMFERWRAWEAEHAGDGRRRQFLVALSGNSSEMFEQDARDAGADLALTKPLALRTVKEIVDRVLKRQ